MNCINENFSDDMYNLIEKLYPICRSITGNGVRETLNIINYIVPIEVNEVPSGTEVFDWTIPKEWNIRDAYVKDSKGKKVIDFKKSNLHVLNYSMPIDTKMSLKELKEHLHTLPEYPSWIPYLTSYYKENWGFCLSQDDYNKLEDDIYDVHIDSTLENGSLTYGEYFLKGEKEEEVLFTCYVCHPSLCNDNLSGIALVTYLAKTLSKLKLKYSYRFLFIPETIGAITWLSLNENKVEKIKYGLVATCCGDLGKLTYKKSRRGKAEIDIIAEQVLKEAEDDYTILNFFPLGSDERQFCSPGFNLPVGSLMRTPYGKFPEYHTSGDNLDFINKDKLEETLEKYLDVVNIIENNETYINLSPKCEPQLGKRGLYSMMGSLKKTPIHQEAILWILNYSDGYNSLLDISKLSNIKFSYIKESADMLYEAKLLDKI
jgi:aminopeptidase-like protein